MIAWEEFEHTCRSCAHYRIRRSMASCERGYFKCMDVDNPASRAPLHQCVDGVYFPGSDEREDET